MNRVKTLCLFAVVMVLITGCKIERTRVVPDVLNTTIDVARAIAGKHGFLLVVLEELESDEVAKGLICKQTPLPGSVMNKGSVLTVAVSKGSAKVVVPDLKGFSLSDARMELFGLRLKLGDVDSAFSDEIEAGRVILSNPLADSKVEKGTTVDLVLSLGKEPEPETIEAPKSKPEIVVPKLTGISLTKAKKLIEDASLTVGEITYKVSSEFYAGTVMAQKPNAQEKVAKGSPVDLVVATELKP